jgi:hypothetical protein
MRESSDLLSKWIEAAELNARGLHVVHKASLTGTHRTGYLVNAPTQQR